MSPRIHTHPVFHQFRHRTLALAVLCGFCWSQSAFALPSGPNVVSGTAGIITSGSTMNITNSANAIINWQGFSIGQGETARFIQPSAASSVLNRVTGGDPSRILGALQSNGKVLLINPNGILFGPGARVDVNGLIASSLGISNQDFLAGRMKFTAGPLAGKVENQGTITTPSGGSVYLIAPDVSNSGVITAPNGDVLLAAGKEVLLVDSSNPEIAMVVTAPEGQSINLGTIVADAGRVGMYGSIVRQKGRISANSATQDASGRIFLKATKEVTLEKDSVTSATALLPSPSGRGAGGEGGVVQISGQHAGLLDNAVVDVSGNNGGGTVLVGGDYQGKNPAIQNAEATYMSKDAVIKADAIDNGNGGKVILWADNVTRAYGSIYSRGGANGGDGGVVETSGKNYLDVNGIGVNTLPSPSGKAGTWLLDPTNITVLTMTPDYTALTEVDAFADPQVGTGYILPTTIGSAASDVVLQATNSITVTDVINMTTASVGITAQAGGNIFVNAPIRTKGGVISLTANDSGGPATGTGAITLSSAGVLDATDNSNNPGGANINLTSTGGTGGITLGAAINAGTSGNVKLNAAGAVTESATASISASGLELLGTGSFTLTEANSVSSLSGNKSGGDVSFSNGSNPLSIGTFATTANLATTAVGITQSGPLTIGGTSVFNGGAGVVTLTNTGNNFTGAVSANNTGANAIQLTDTNAIDLGSINTANNLTVNAVGMTQSGPLTIGGTSTFNGGAGVVTLNNSGNNFTGAVSANNTGANAIQLTDTNAIILGTINTTNNLAVNAVGITQSGPITVGGTSTFNGGAGVITLNGTNNLTGAVSASNTGANAVQLSNVLTLDMGPITTANGPVMLNSNQDLLVNNPITTSGGNFTSSSVGATIFTAAGDISTGTGTINIQAQGVAGASIPAGTALSGSTVSIAANAFSLAGSITATGDVSVRPYTKTNAVCIYGSTDCSGALNITPASLAAISTPGILIVGGPVSDPTYTGNLTINSGTTISTLNVGTLALNGNNVTIESGAGVTTSSNLHLLAKNSLTMSSGASIDAGTVFMSAQNGSISLNAAGVSGFTSLSGTAGGNINLVADSLYGAYLSSPSINLTIGAKDPAGRLNFSSYPSNPTYLKHAYIAATNPNTITLNFPNLYAGGYVINGTEGGPTTLGPYPSTGMFVFGSPAVLGSGFVVNYGLTPPPVCPAGTELVGGSCVPITCATGYQLIAGKCEPITCSVGYVLVGSTCQPTTDTCMANPTLPGCSSVLPALDTCISAPSTPGCTAVLPSLTTCTSAPTAPGCSVVLPSLSSCIANPSALGCSVVLPNIAACTANPTLPGCSVVLPSLAVCTSAPTTPGCSAVLPNLTSCIETPSLPGCSVILSSLNNCIATPSLPGCSVVLPSLTSCIANPSASGCSAVLPSLAVCTAAPTMPGCSVVLPSLNNCIATPSLPGCSVVLPSLNNCIATPSLPGCSVVLPSLNSCIASPSMPGCSAVLPSIAACSSNPTLPGCSVVMPSLATCIASPGTIGCGAVLPSMPTCIATPSIPGCSVVLPTIAACTSAPTTPGCSVVLPPVVNQGLNPSANQIVNALGQQPTTPVTPTGLQLISQAPSPTSGQGGSSGGGGSDGGDNSQPDKDKDKNKKQGQGSSSSQGGGSTTDQNKLPLCPTR